MKLMKKQVGRPRKNKRDKQKFARLAIYPETHKIIKSRAKKDKTTMADLMVEKTKDW